LPIGNFDSCRLVISLFSFTLPILIGAGFKVRAFIVYSSQEVRVSTEKVDFYLVLKERGYGRFLSFAPYSMLKVNHRASWLLPERLERGAAPAVAELR
jgi:hypothetical protein